MRRQYQGPCASRENSLGRFPDGPMRRALLVSICFWRHTGRDLSGLDADFSCSSPYTACSVRLYGLAAFRIVGSRPWSVSCSSSGLQIDSIQFGRNNRKETAERQDMRPN